MAPGAAQGRRAAGRLRQRRHAVGRLRRWYGHDPAKFGEFRRRYAAELDMPGQREALARLRALAADGPVTLLAATRDLSLSQAVVLAEVLQDTT